MREYKFRGKAIKPMADGNQWIEDGFGVYHIKAVNGKDECILYTPHGHYHVDPATVGQYTGLKDKNGKEVYEGDLLKIPDLYETPENTYMTYHNEAINFKNYTFNLGDDPLCDDYEYISDECEVIGNIHDNPELLEG